MKMPLYFIYLIYTTGLALVMVALVPRKDIYKYAVLSVFYGAVIDVLWIGLILIIKTGGYLNYLPLGLGKLPFLPPVAWTIYFIMFLYFLPEKKPWNYLFALVGSCYSVMFSNVLVHLGVFQWSPSRILFPFALYLTWHVFVVWSYDKYGRKFVRYALRRQDE